jgi:S-phase kinase-associated protein 1
MSAAAPASVAAPAHAATAAPPPAAHAGPQVPGLQLAGDVAMGDVPDQKDAKKDEKKDAGAIKGLDADPHATKPLKLTSKDKKEFTLPRGFACISTLIKTSLENDDKADEVPVLGVTGATLELVINYAKEHKGVEPPIIEKPLRSKVMKDVCPCAWDADFIDAIAPARQQLYDLILAANYMDIKSLLHLGCAKVASLIKGQPLEKIKEILDPSPKKADGKAPDQKDAKAGSAAEAAAPSAAPASGGASAAATKGAAPAPAGTAATALPVAAAQKG